MTRAAVYLRQSLDRTGESAAIERQRNACRALCAAREWDMVAEYVDNDTSASKRRGDDTGYGQMLRDARAGRFDVVVAFAVDRIARRPSDIERLIDLGVKAATVQGGLDLSTPEGEGQASILVTFARLEVRQKALRQRAMHEQRRQAGRPWRGPRAFGWTADGMTLVDEEAHAVRAAADALLTGASLQSIADRWNSAGWTTAYGKPWAPYSVRTVLLNPRVAAKQAQIEKTGRWQLLGGTGAWPAILTEDVWLAVDRLLRDPRRRPTSNTARVSLLSNIATCGVLVDGAPCGLRLSTGGMRGVRTLRCEGPVKHLARKAEPIEQHVTRLVLARLRRPDAAGLLEHGRGDELVTLNAALAEKRRALDDLADLLADGTLDATAVRATSARLRAEITALEQRAADTARPDLLAPLVVAPDVEQAWTRLDLGARRAVIETLTTVAVLPGRMGGRAGFDPATVLVEPRR